MRKRILVVEDEAIIANSLKICLEEHGYHVLDIVSTGDDAIVSAKDDNPDIVLMDVRLRGALNGYETVIQIRLHSTVPVIYATGGNRHEVAELAKETKPYDYVLKPYDIAELVQKIEAMFV
jgi:DNA-binding response OmpR family regulator